MSKQSLGALLSGFLFAGISSLAVALPIADAGSDRFTYAGSGILLNGGGYSPEGKTLTDVLWNVDTAPSNSVFNLETPNYPFSYFVGYTPGIYNLSFSVFDGDFWSVPDSMSIQVVTNSAPVALASANPLAGVTPLTVNFDASASYDPEGRPLSYYWSLGDGSDGSYEQSFTHTYTFPGIFSVSLEVTDELGATAFTVLHLDVARFNLAPMLTSVALPSSGINPLSVQFLANAVDPDNDPLTYLWDFGDPNRTDDFSTLPDPTYVYSAPGTYFPSLVVNDGRLSSQKILSVFVDGHTVPEPGTWGLLANGAGILALFRRRRINTSRTC